MVHFSFYQAFIYRLALLFALFSYFLVSVDFFFPSLSYLPGYGVPFSEIFIPNVLSVMHLGYLPVFLCSIVLSVLFLLSIYPNIFGFILLYLYLCTYCNFLPVLPSPSDGFLPYSILFTILLFPSNLSVFSRIGTPYLINNKLFVSVRLVFTSAYFIHGILSLFIWLNQSVSWLQLYWNTLCVLYGILYWFPRTRGFSWLIFTISLVVINPYSHLAFLFSAIAVQIFMLDPKAVLFPRKKGVVFVDGFCVLCNRWAEFVIKEDYAFNLKIASIQGSYGKEHLPKRLQEEGSTIVLRVGNRSYEKSGAILRIFYMLGGVWSIFAVFFILPPFMRDFLYDYIARNRYRFFGRKKECFLPGTLGKDKVLN